METSAKTNMNIDKAFEMITREIYDEACRTKDKESNFLLNKQRQSKKCC